MEHSEELKTTRGTLTTVGQPKTETKQRCGVPALTYTVVFSFVSTDPSAVMTVVCRLDTRTVSKSAKFKSSLLDTCIDALESTTRSLSSSLIVDGQIKKTPIQRKRENTWPCFAHIPCFTASPSLVFFFFKIYFLKTMIEFLERRNFVLH